MQSSLHTWVGPKSTQELHCLVQRGGHTLLITVHHTETLTKCCGRRVTRALGNKHLPCPQKIDCGNTFISRQKDVMRISKLDLLILQNGVRRKQLSDLTLLGLVSESHCVLCWMDKMLASCLLGSASLAQGKSMPSGPSSAPGPIFWCSWERRFGSFRAFNILMLLLPPTPSPTLYSMRTKKCFIAMSLLHYWSKLASQFFF